MPPTHTPTIHPMSIKDISMFLYRKQIFVILPFHFFYLIESRNGARFLLIFVLYILTPLSIPPTMHIVNSINSICLDFICSVSFIQWNQTDPAALSIPWYQSLLSFPALPTHPTKHLRKIRENVHNWLTFFTTVGRDSCNNSHLWFNLFVLFHFNALYPF